jgi:hypothetical protein
MSFRLVFHPRWPGNLEDATSGMVDHVGDIVLEGAIRAVPVLTFALQNSLEVQRIGEGSKRVNRIGANEDYVQDGQRPADYIQEVELGNSRQDAQPFLRPAILQAGASL